ncbi:MAG: HAMP domain-containing histidine kinase [Gemmatimonadetes bacterium]|nr:HAMP domain-containing histidine kinase [Gemmatimonadota bacterium]
MIVLGAVALALAFLLVVLLLREAALRRQLAELRTQLRAVEELGRLAEQSRTRFFGAVAHDLKTPLTAVIGYQELLADGVYGELPERAREALRRLGRAGEQLSHLIDGLTDLVGPDAQSRQPNLQPVDLRRILFEALDAAAAAAAERNLTLTRDLPPELPAVHTDPEKLRQLLDFAFTSAIRAASQPTLHAVLRVEGPLAWTLELGPTALPAEPPLATAPLPDAEAVPRLGLRLAIARRLARALGGQVLLLPENDATTLRIRLVGAPASAH